MAFKFSQSPTFKTTVTVNVPNEKGGFDKSTFVGVFLRPKDDERKALADLSHADLARKMLKGWEMKDDETKQDVPFSEEMLDAALAISPTPFATANAFWEALNGARSKN